MKFPSYPEYVHSGNAWVGLMPRRWKLLRADFVTSSNKMQVSEKDLERIDVFHYSIPNVQNFGTGQAEQGDHIDSAKLTIIRPQLLVSKLNPRKATVCIAEPHESLMTVCSGEFVPLVPDEELNLKYCYYLWISDKVTKLLSSQVQSVTKSHQRVAPENITKLFWAWPSAAEQRQITHFLDWKTGQIDALIARKKKLIGKLNEQRLAVITHAVTKGLNPHATMHDSGFPWLGHVPEQWQVKRVKFLTKILRGQFSHRPRNDPAFYDGDYPFVQTGDVARAGKYVETYSQTLNERGLSVSRQFPAGTLVMTIAANIGDMAIIRFPACFPDSIVGFVPEPGVNLEFLYYMFVAMKQRLMMTAVLNTQLNLNIDRIASIEAIAPPPRIQEEIVNYLDCELNRIQQLIDKVTAAIDHLIEYRTALITAATTGKIDVRDVVIVPTA